ncbi:hypothetical protein F2Q70_00008959 [Brassica cretica]|uniref:Uncharacterized protein n=1 Tax=Brassica cretica TaxID=69181 RepID=A0A8S9LW34_BRACR|nr:hypothetical protein F2Q68_00002016 [Brassica cretica]KAF2612190.1 hypothetical protein F2Q70_00008959 [Brassica cretica]
MRLHDVNEVRSHVGDLDGPCPGRLLAKATGSWSPPAGDPFAAGPGRQLATRTERVLSPAGNPDEAILVACWRPGMASSQSPDGDMDSGMCWNGFFPLRRSFGSLFAKRMNNLFQELIT